AESKSGVDRRNVAIAADRIGGEENSGDVGIDQLLHDDREPDSAMTESVARAIEHSAIGEQRNPAAAHGVEQRRLPSHVEISVLLPGEACARKIFRGRARSHRQWSIDAE